MGGIGLVVSDFIISFMWAWSGSLIKIFVYEVLDLGHESSGEIIKSVLYIINMFFFAFLGNVTKGGAYNPLTILSSALSGDFSRFIFTVGARIPAQVLGSITGVRLIIQTFPEVGVGPQLKVDIHRGALTEGILTFAIVMISLGLSRKIPGSFFMKTWISSVCKLTLQILGSSVTGGCMNPASVMGWAYARGDHITKEHVLVYWLAPIEATLLAVWTFRLMFRPQKEEKAKAKSD
ncbi:LOW QUALITY PROTEIN: probable aquaporin SIP2-1 [Ziziphus jujuba]|uniref:LOW QUALITY PROTEIN: probable aquaporin SIP2-1 n=1 Tax=Ziziphus jujuba TaxID=326968 RepID=A0ABM3IQQ6_ZIZJJ|nr:LOW QUALITY PROTEIN: probable aquaporin SIP2-1 [Ziziphus jujuba]